MPLREDRAPVTRRGPSHRVVALTSCVALLALAACQSDPETRIFAAKSVSFPPPGTAETLDTFEACGMCHFDIYQDWQGSMHAQGWTSPLFQAIYTKWYADDPNVVDCRTCHAPSSLAVTGYGHEPRVTAGNLDNGVTCLSCHLGAHGEILGPRGSADAPHTSVQMDVFGKVELCDSCHGIEGDELLDNMKREWGETGLAAEGVTCQSCHMPLAERTLYTGAEPGLVRRHTFQGGHDAAWLEGVVTLGVEAESDAIVVVVTNQKTGHNFPAGCIWRRVLVTTRFVPADGSAPAEWVEAYSTEKRRVLVRNQPERLRYAVPSVEGTVEVAVTYRSVDAERAEQLGTEIQQMFQEKPVASGVFRVTADPLAVEVESLFDRPTDPDAYRLPPRLDPWLEDGR